MRLLRLENEGALLHCQSARMKLAQAMHTLPSMSNEFTPPAMIGNGLDESGLESSDGFEFSAVLPRSALDSGRHGRGLRLWLHESGRIAA